MGGGGILRCICWYCLWFLHNGALVKSIPKGLRKKREVFTRAQCITGTYPWHLHERLGVRLKRVGGAHKQRNTTTQLWCLHNGHNGARHRPQRRKGWGMRTYQVIPVVYVEWFKLVSLERVGDECQNIVFLVRI